MLQFNWIVVIEEFKIISEVPMLDWSLSSIGRPKCANLKPFIGVGTCFFERQKRLATQNNTNICWDTIKSRSLYCFFGMVGLFRQQWAKKN